MLSYLEFLALPVALRHVAHTANAIEGVHRQVRKRSRPARTSVAPRVAPRAREDRWRCQALRTNLDLDFPPQMATRSPTSGRREAIP